jgi:hypothetical protein
VAAPGGAEAWTVRRVVRDLHKDNAKLIGSAVSDI